MYTPINTYMDATRNIFRMYARRPSNPNEVFNFTSEKNATIRIRNMSTLIQLDMLFRMALKFLDPTTRKRSNANSIFLKRCCVFG